eukprot:scaffold135474_cov38-Prasinocladus_malaysianus.AAC.2
MLRRQSNEWTALMVMVASPARKMCLMSNKAALFTHAWDHSNQHVALSLMHQAWETTLRDYLFGKPPQRPCRMKLLKLNYFVALMKAEQACKPNSWRVRFVSGWDISAYGQQNPPKILSLNQQARLGSGLT